MMKNVIPDFKSTLSIFPYFLNSLSTSDCLASKSRFPQKIGFIFPNASATNLQCNVRRKDYWDSETVKLNELLEEEEGDVADLMIRWRICTFSEGDRVCEWTLGLRFGEITKCKGERKWW